MKKQSCLSVLFIFLLGLVPFLFCGCDAGGGDSDNIVPPTPPAPPVPATILPEATQVDMFNQTTSEILKGSYLYQNADGESEGHSIYTWEDENNIILSHDKTFSYDRITSNLSVKFCVTPVTYSGIQGTIKCSPVHKIISSVRTVHMSTDWSTDSDYSAEEGASSGNAHFFYNINLTPLNEEQYHFAGNQLSISDTEPVDRGVNGNHADFEMDKIYTTHDGKDITLVNHTPRRIKNPVIRINDEYYYQINTTIDAFTVNHISGYNSDEISNISFMDPNPGYKLYISGYDNYENMSQTVAAPFFWLSDAPFSLQRIYQNTKPKRDSSLDSYCFQNNYQQPCYESVTDDGVAQYNMEYRILKIAVNRFDTVKYYFDWYNNDQSIDGLSLGYPFSDLTEESEWCNDKPDISNPTHGLYDAGCGGNGVAHKYEYRVHGLKRILSHPNESYIINFLDDDWLMGAAGISQDTTYQEGTIEMEDDFTMNIGTLAHENIHRLGYSDDSGIPPWMGGNVAIQGEAPIGGLANIMTHHDYFFLSHDGNDSKVIEESDYLADYHWVDPMTVDVHFYNKGATESSNIIRNLAVIADDEESVLGYAGNAVDGRIYTNFDTRGAMGTTPDIIIINENTVRIKLTHPFVNNSKSIFVFASSADTNTDTGVWKTDYLQHTGDSIALEIPYDHNIELNDSVDKVVYVSQLSDLNDTMRNGNIAHIGSTDFRLKAPDYYLTDNYYQHYTVEEANNYCVSRGYRGLGMIPSINDLSSLGYQVNQMVYTGTVVGLDEQHKPVMLKAAVDSGSLPSVSPVSINDHKASLIVCRY